MKKSFSAGVMLLFAALMLVSSAKVYADAFAHNIRFTQPSDASAAFDGKFDDGSGIAIRFVLSDYADSVIIYIKSGSTLVKTIKNENFVKGDTVVIWDGKNEMGKFVGKGNYSVSISTMNPGYFDYTVLSNQGIPISTRGVTCVTNTAVKNFGFIYAASSGSTYVTGAARHSADGIMWGDTKGSPKITTTGIALGDPNARYSSEADKEGYIYVIGRDNRQLLRYHADTLDVKVVDSSGYAGWFLNGIGIRENNGGKFIAIAANNANSAAGTDSKVFGFELGSNTSYFGTKQEVLVGDTSIIFWDVAFGRDNLLYVTFFGKSDNIRPGIAAFNYTGATLHMKDTLWTSTVTAGRGNTCCYYKGATPDLDVLYFTIARRFSGDAAAPQNVYCVNKLNTIKEQGTVYVDPQNNMTQYRSDITVDAVGNVIFFENSNEEVTIIAPPFGQNRFTTPAYDQIAVTSATGVESVDVIPQNFFVNQNYPNPFNPTTAIKFGLTNESVVDLRVYNMLGQEVATLINGQPFGAGTHIYTFDASKLASGVYVYRLQAGNNVAVKKMQLLK
jgi:hypothetical protein